MDLDTNKTKMICGIDEAGRGPLAGPVFAAAVVLPLNFDFLKLADSKKLSEKKRKELAIKIFSECIFGIGHASVKEIDSLNILQATMLAMVRAFRQLSKKLSTVELSKLSIIVDGNQKPKIESCKTVIKADQKIYSVMAASIIAKVIRDRLMIYYGKKYPNYGFEKHKGYCTKYHVNAILKYGPSPIQRKTFKLPKS